MAAGTITSISLNRKKFKAAKSGGPIAAAARKKSALKTGATITYVLSNPATVTFSIEQRKIGRKTGGKCRAKTGKNKRRKHCKLLAVVKDSSFARASTFGTNSFDFTGRTSRRALKTGTYVLVGDSGTSTKSIGFTIAR